MRITAEAAAAERKVLARYEARLARAERAAYYSRKGVFTSSAGWVETTTQVKAMETLAILVASAKALYPGQQKRKHVLPALGVMVTAACRVIRGSK